MHSGNQAGGTFAAASPLRGSLEVRDRRPGGLSAALVVDPAEPVLAGHFPGFPIFPGVCLVECAHQAALLALPAGAALAGIPSTRFLAPVFGGDEVLVEVDTSGAAEGWDCSVRLAKRPAPDAEPVEAALVRLRYRHESGSDGHR